MSTVRVLVQLNVFENFREFLGPTSLSVNEFVRSWVIFGFNVFALTNDNFINSSNLFYQKQIVDLVDTNNPKVLLAQKKNQNENPIVDFKFKCFIRPKPGLLRK